MSLMFGLSDSVVVVVVVRFYFGFYSFSGIEGYVDCHGCCDDSDNFRILFFRF